MKYTKLLFPLFVLLLFFNDSTLHAQSRGSSRIPQDAETYKPDNDNRKIKELDVTLPMRFNRQRLKLEIVDNMAIYEGDIVLGHEAEFNGEVSFAVAIANNTYRWEDGIMPYVLSPSHPRKTEILQAIDHINKKTKICMVERTNERDYVNFLSGSGCWSYVGRQTFEQAINIGNCSLGSIIHEICHAAGLYHEQSRSDRDQFIEIKWDNISEDKKQNFDRKDATGMDIGVYDFGSVMHYPATAFSKNGQPTIVSKVGAKAFGQRDGLSPMDISALNNLYSEAPGCGNEEVVVAPPTTGTGGGTTTTTLVPTGGGETKTPNPTTGTGGGETKTPNPTTGTGGGETKTPNPTTGTGGGETKTPNPTTGIGGGETKTPNPTTGTGGGETKTPNPTTGTNLGTKIRGGNLGNTGKPIVTTPEPNTKEPKPIQGKVSFFSEVNYEGKSIQLTTGRYSVEQLLKQLGTENIRSVLFGKELVIEFYLKDRNRKVLSESIPNLTDFKERYEMLIIKGNRR
ncbi:MAG: M12 family metallopeptidase [Chitinophagales bacterium]